LPKLGKRPDFEEQPLHWLGSLQSRLLEIDLVRELRSKTWVSLYSAAMRIALPDFLPKGM
jgi:hypothetical protein